MLTEAEFAEAVEAVRNDHEPSIPDLTAHDRAQRAEIERLNGALGEAQGEADSLRFRAEKAEARLAALLASNAALVEQLKKAEAELLKVAHAIGIVHEPDTGPCWPGTIEEIVREAASARARAEKAEAALSIEREASAIALRAEQMQRITAETRVARYLAAMRDAVRAYDRLAWGGYGGDLAVAWAAIRAIVEEARRG